MFIAFLIAEVLSLVGSNSIKYWVHSNNWNNPKNWDISPDPCDAVLLPDLGYEYSVLVSSNVHLNSLELPSTGEVVFAERASLSYSGLGSCLGPVRNTYRTRQYGWGDPNNWYSPSLESVFSVADSEKIPCWTDTVVFNRSTVYSVLVEKSVEVGALYISDTSLSTEDIGAYTASAGRAQLQFMNLAEVVVTGRTVCTNPEGCLCGNQLDCSLVQCPRQHCVKAIRSKGICCHYCGAEVRFRPPAGFYLMKFKERLANFLKETGQLNDDIAITVSLQEYELRLNIQITVSDAITDGSYEGAGYESSRVSLKIHDYIVKYDIVRGLDIIMEQSHHLAYSTETQESKDLTPAITAGIQSWILYVVLSVSIVLLLVVVFLLFKCSKRYRDNHSSHLRLDTGALPRTVNRRFKPCVPAPDQDIPTYEEVLMEDMLTRGIAPDQPRTAPAVRPPIGPPRTRPGYSEIPTTDISDHSRV